MEKDLNIENWITLACSEEAWEKHLFSKGNFYYTLSFYLEECDFLINAFPKFSNEDFPPSFEHIVKKAKKTYPSKPAKPIHSQYREFFKKAKFDIDRFDDLDVFLDDVSGFFGNGIDAISKIGMEDKDSLGKLASLSFLMAATFYTAPFFEDAKKHIFCIQRYDNLTLNLLVKVFTTLGYWTVKMEEKKRNLKSVSVRTEKRMDNIKIIEKMLEDKQFQVDRDLISQAMRKTDRYERTVKNMIKEIKEKKNK